MKKNIFILFGLLFLFKLFALDYPTYRVLNDTFSYRSPYFREKYKVKEYKKGDVVEGLHAGGFIHGTEGLSITTTENIFPEYISFDQIVPIDTKDLFDASVITKKDFDYIYVPEYQMIVLQSKTRNLLEEKYEKYCFEIQSTNNYKTWYENYNVKNYIAISNSVIDIGFSSDTDERDFSLLTKIIEKKTNKHYLVKVVNGKNFISGIENNYREVIEPSWMSQRLPHFINGEVYQLELKFDGDYLYTWTIVDDVKKEFQTFVKINEATKNEINTLVHTESCDLSRVTWPRHADGSCDYDGKPLSKGTTGWGSGGYLE